MSLNQELVTRIRAEVAGQLSLHTFTGDDRGRPRMTEAEEREVGERLISAALETHARGCLTSGQPLLARADEDAVGRAVTDALFGLGGLQRYLDDPEVENIHANGCDVVWVRYVDRPPVRGEPIAGSDDELIHLVRTWAARFGLSERRFDNASPHLSMRLPDGSRLSALMSVTERPCVAVRRHRFLSPTLDELMEWGTIDEPLRDLLDASVRAELTVMVGGGTGVGKTTFLRGLASSIEPGARLVTIEDSLELGLGHNSERHPDVVACEAREPNIEGAGRITIADLVRWSLRLSPDRIIVGEVRGDEVIPMLNAISSGATAGSMCTIHANQSRQVFGKLSTYALQAPERLPVEATNMLVAQAVDLVVQLSSRGRQRLVSSVREVVGADGAQVVSNEIFAPGPDGRALVHHPVRGGTMERLVAVGFDPGVLDSARRWRS